jgi:NAD(P)-dependent dehydrogenase (short-subunit alcohol dehydrogenase family)
MLTEKSKLAFGDIGRGEPALLLLPGCCADRGILTALAELLSKKRRVINADLLGHNESDRPEGNFESEDVIREASKLIDSFGINEFITVSVDHFSRLDILVNNAGAGEVRPLLEVDEAHFARMFDLNVRGLLLTSREAARYFSDAGGRIINVSSSAGVDAMPNLSVYASTKAAVDSLTRSHAAELGPLGITVNAVTPGPTTSDAYNASISKEARQASFLTTGGAGVVATLFSSLPDPQAAIVKDSITTKVIFESPCIAGSLEFVLELLELEVLVILFFAK